MKLLVSDFASKAELGDIEFSDKLFSAKKRLDIVHKVVRWQLLGRMSGSHKAKTVSDISGTTRKPFKQKGTGSARQGSKRSVHMRGGACAHPPVVRSHAISLPKKVRRLGLRILLSDKLVNDKLSVVKDIVMSSHKSRDLMLLLSQYSGKSFFMVDDGRLDENLVRSSSNLKNVLLMNVMGINVYDMLRYDYLIISSSALKSLESRLL